MTPHSDSLGGTSPERLRTKHQQVPTSDVSRSSAGSRSTNYLDSATWSPGGQQHDSSLPMESLGTGFGPPDDTGSSFQVGLNGTDGELVPEPALPDDLGALDTFSSTMYSMNMDTDWCVIRRPYPFSRSIVVDRCLAGPISNRCFRHLLRYLADTLVGKHHLNLILISDCHPVNRPPMGFHIISSTFCKRTPACEIG